MNNPRVLAAQILHRVIYQGDSLSDALLSDTLNQLSAQDKALLMDMCFGTLRQHERLSALLDELLVKPLKKKDKDIEALLRLGLYQMLYQRIPDHAAINETVKASKKMGKTWAKGLINAVLRSLQRNQDTLLKHVDEHPEVNKGLPDWLHNKLAKAWPEHWKAIAKASNTKAPMSLRVNLNKIARADYLNHLQQQSIAVIEESLNLKGLEAAITLQKAVNVEELPGFNEGWVSVQDLAAQYAAVLLNATENMHVLDACAAPGGKTGHIAERDSRLHLTALDISEARLERVSDNLQRLNIDQSTVRLMTADLAQPDHWWDGHAYDRILLDAPCSATGVIRRHPDIKVLRKASDIPQLTTLQAELLDSTWQMLSVGGRLVYATCSILPEENEQQIKAFLKRQTNARLLPIDPTLMSDIGVTLEYGWQLFPGDANIDHSNQSLLNVSMDGFYYAILQKEAE